MNKVLNGGRTTLIDIPTGEKGDEGKGGGERGTPISFPTSAAEKGVISTKEQGRVRQITRMGYNSIGGGVNVFR